MAAEGSAPAKPVSQTIARKWERRWVLTPNVLELSGGDIWVQRWVPAAQAAESQAFIDKVAAQCEEQSREADTPRAAGADGASI